MALITAIRKNSYQDSMKLMQISRKLGALSGVRKASAIMATEANLRMLRDAGLIGEGAISANAGDMVVAIEAESEQAAQGAMEKLDSLLDTPKSAKSGEMRYATFDAAIKALPQANIAVVSLPGEYAKLEVAKAIERGLHTFLFSDNLSVEEEVELKERASARGLLVMGPGCGTAIIGGVGLGFANVVRRGPVGIIAAAGTGMQEVSSLIHNLGSGISHAIGVGGRDLSERVGGIMAAQAIGMLQRDVSTEILLLVSKPPSDKVAARLIDAIAGGGKPAVVCFLGKKLSCPDPKIKFASSLEEAALETLRLLNQGRQPSFDISPKKRRVPRGGNLVEPPIPGQIYLRGLFAGGTLCYEAQQELAPILGAVYSNAPLDKAMQLADSHKSKRHTCVDMGEEEFTKGRPHPMIDASQRAERLIREARDPKVAVILLDVVLGYVASADPAADLVPAIREARKIASRRRRPLAFVAHVCGTDRDPQGLEAQEEKLQREGVLTFPTNAQASRAAGQIALGRGKRQLPR
ncbi:MAG: acyl-CoA synthetase FdrA [Deltaproteobacteria bacterium]